MAQKLSLDDNGVQSTSSPLAWYQALTLPERLNSLPTSAGQSAPDDPELAERRLQKWKQQAPFDQADYFVERLAQDGISETELRYLLGEASASLQARIAEPPAWLLTLEQILATANSAQDFAFMDAEKSGKPALFLNVLKPLLKYGIDRFQQGVKQLAARYQSLPFQPEEARESRWRNRIDRRGSRRC